MATDKNYTKNVIKIGADLTGFRYYDKLLIIDGLALFCSLEEN